jgi:plastocyanin
MLQKAKLIRRNAMKSSRITSIMLLAIVMFWGVNASRAGTISGNVTIKGARTAKDVVVYIETMEGEFEPPEKHAVMDQKNLTFLPHILPVIEGTTVDYRNSDEVLHNVFCPDKCADKFNLGTWAKGEVRSYTFNNLGCISVMLCNVHPEMEAWIVVLQNPYYNKTDDDGGFIIENVPSGKYTLIAWHEKFKGAPQQVMVPEKGEVTINFKMKRK